MKKAVLMVVVLLAIGGVAQAAQLDITTLPGYGYVESNLFNFNAAGGWAGWSVPTGKVVLCAEIISAHSFQDFSVFRPAGPGEAFPHYTYGPSEYGWVMRAKYGQALSGVKIRVHYANPIPGYTITKSVALYYGDTGWGGWSAPAGHFVTGGGYQFVNQYSSAQKSEIALENSVWPHYTYGPNEQGWVVQACGGGEGYVYVVSNTIPELPSSVLALTGGLGGLLPLIRWRRR